MKIEAKLIKDEDFTPRDIRKRACYRKISDEIKNLMAKLYYIEHVKMSKLVKKYNVSFSTITDILKKYDQNAQRIFAPLQKPSNPRKVQETASSSPHRDPSHDVKVEEVQEEHSYVVEQLESPHNPEYVFYEN